MWFGTASHRPRLLSRRRTRYRPFGDNFCGSSDATAPAQNHLKSNTQNHCRACSGGSKCSWNNTLHDAAVHVSQISSQYQFHICISMGQNSNPHRLSRTCELNFSTHLCLIHCKVCMTPLKTIPCTLKTTGFAEENCVFPCC